MFVDLSDPSGGLVACVVPQLCSKRPGGVRCPEFGVMSLAKNPITVNSLGVQGFHCLTQRGDENLTDGSL